MRPSVIDFFCGCGGTSAGLAQAGMEILGGIDVDSIALGTFKKNFPNAAAIEADITELTVTNLRDQLGRIKRPLVFAACAPCQPFSKQNRYKQESDGRGTLLDELHEFVEEMKPDYIVLENVPGLQRIKEGPFFKFLAFLESSGYEYDFDVKDAVNYGVPQTRRRLVLLASRHGAICLPKPTHGASADMKAYETVADAISNYPELEAGAKDCSVANHEAAKISDINIERLKHTPEGGDRRDWPDRLVLECHKRKVGYTDTYGRLKGNEPAKTLTTKCFSISNGRFGHPSQNRALSVREAAALQTFPDEFEFEGTLTQAARQVGNAVPVKFAKALGDAILSHHGSL